MIGVSDSDVKALWLYFNKMGSGMRSCIWDPVRFFVSNQQCDNDSRERRLITWMERIFTHCHAVTYLLTQTPDLLGRIMILERGWWLLMGYDSNEQAWKWMQLTDWEVCDNRWHGVNITWINKCKTPYLLCPPFHMSVIMWTTQSTTKLLSVYQQESWYITIQSKVLRLNSHPDRARTLVHLIQYKCPTGFIRISLTFCFDDCGEILMLYECSHLVVHSVSCVIQ